MMSLSLFVSERPGYRMCVRTHSGYFRYANRREQQPVQAAESPLDAHCGFSRGPFRFQHSAMERFSHTLFSPCGKIIFPRSLQPLSSFRAMIRRIRPPRFPRCPAVFP